MGMCEQVMRKQYRLRRLQVRLARHHRVGMRPCLIDQRVQQTAIVRTEERARPVAVDADDADAKQLAEQLPSTNSSDHGSPFAEIFARVNGDFYKIDGALFSPAEVIVTSVNTGKSFRGGRLMPELVEASFA